MGSNFCGYLLFGPGVFAKSDLDSAERHIRKVLRHQKAMFNKLGDLTLLHDVEIADQMVSDIIYGSNNYEDLRATIERSQLPLPEFLETALL